jgi:hypothetical protein
MLTRAFAVYVASTSTYIPPTQTVCGADRNAQTVVYEGPEQTEYEVDYVTYTTWQTVWIGCVVPRVPAPDLGDCGYTDTSSQANLFLDVDRLEHRYAVLGGWRILWRLIVWHVVHLNCCGAALVDDRMDSNTLAFP